MKKFKVDLDILKQIIFDDGCNNVECIIKNFATDMKVPQKIIRSWLIKKTLYLDDNILDKISIYFDIHKDHLIAPKPRPKSYLKKVLYTDREINEIVAGL